MPLRCKYNIQDMNKKCRIKFPRQIKLFSHDPTIPTYEFPLQIKLKQFIFKLKNFIIFYPKSPNDTLYCLILWTWVSKCLCMSLRYKSHGESDEKTNTKPFVSVSMATVFWHLQYILNASCLFKWYISFMDSKPRKMLLQHF